MMSKTVDKTSSCLSFNGILNCPANFQVSEASIDGIDGASAVINDQGRDPGNCPRILSGESIRKL